MIKFIRLSFLRARNENWEKNCIDAITLVFCLPNSDCAQGNDKADFDSHNNIFCSAYRDTYINAYPHPFAIAERIQYDIDNEIWIRVQGEIEDDKPKFYEMSGMKGQEINPHFYYLSPDGSWIKETKIYDKNGNIIQPEWTGDFGGWSGKLPSTQEYLISLRLNEPKRTSFILEILNIPQHQESGYFNYTDKQNGFEITYSQNDFTPYSNQSSTDVFSVSLDTEKYFSGTILQSSDLMISIFPECLEPYDSQLAEKANIINAPFKKFITYDATATTGFELAIFQTNHNNMCYQILVRSNYFILAHFPDSGLKDFSRSVLYTKIYRLLNTFKFTK